jgi:hypothetical protein|nr:MAG TPA: hypothetical protein [Caudoviricetes sp.]
MDNLNIKEQKEKLMEQLAQYGITTEKQLDAALADVLSELDIGIMTMPIPTQDVNTINN